jgi:hypothetical protein
LRPVIRSRAQKFKDDLMAAKARFESIQSQTSVSGPTVETSQRNKMNASYISSDLGTTANLVFNDGVGTHYQEKTIKRNKNRTKMNSVFLSQKIPAGRFLTNSSV